jgi:peptide/nickel transport system substrate-binding protein
MTDDTDRSRRRFLKATGAATVTAAVAGCSGGGDGTATPGDTDEPDDTPETDDGTTTTDDGTDPTDGPTQTPEPDVDLPEMYPYGINETRIDEARRVMEDAGYGPDNMYQLNHWIGTSGAAMERGQAMQSRLEAAHIDVELTPMSLLQMVKQGKQGKHEMLSLGWIMDYPSALNFFQLFTPKNTTYNLSGSTPNGGYLMWSEGAKASEDLRTYMNEQYDRFLANQGATDEQQQLRNDVVRRMAEANWKAAAMIPTFHTPAEYFWYDRLDVDVPGSAGRSRAKSHRTVNAVEGKDNLADMSTPVTTLDPIVSGDVQSGEKIMNMFDALMNYPNGQTNVETLLAENYEVSDDFTTYTFKLKEGVQFHGDYGELTADDVVYSLKRSIVSENSTNASFLQSVVGVVHETEEATRTVENEEGETTEETYQRVVPDSIGIRKTGEYEVEVELQSPFSYTLTVLAYSAFSAIPEGLVGDVPGYEGELSQQEFSTDNPIGTGPFTFESWEQGNGGEFNLTRFEDYHGETPPFEQINYTILDNVNARHTKFINRESDFGVIPSGQYDPGKVSIDRTDDRGRQIGTYGPLENDETVNYAKVPEINVGYLAFNMQKVPTPVRRAVAYAFNSQEFNETINKERGVPAFHIVPPGVFPGGAEGYDAHYQE